MTYDRQVTVKIDYLEVVLIDPTHLFGVFGFTLSDLDLVGRSPLQGYDLLYEAKGLSIKVHLIFHEDVDELEIDNIDISEKVKKIRVSLSGHGCDAFAKSRPDGWTWIETLTLLKDRDAQVRRLDLALDAINCDDRHARVPTVKKLRDVYREQRRIFSPFRSFRYIESGKLQEDDPINFGATFYIGVGDQILRIYDKLAEQKSGYQPIPESVRTWTRFELQLRAEKSQQAVKKILEEQSIQNALFQILQGSYRFTTPKIAKQIHKSKKSAWDFPSAYWWRKLLQGATEARLIVEKPSLDLYRKQRFIERQAKPTMFQLKLVNIYHAYREEEELFELDSHITTDELFQYGVVLEKLDRWRTNAWVGSSERDYRQYERFVETVKLLIVQGDTTVTYHTQQWMSRWVEKIIDHLIARYNLETEKIEIRV